MQSYREGMGRDDRGRILRQPAGGLRGHGIGEYRHGFVHLVDADSHCARSETAVAAKDWIGADVCRGIAVRIWMIGAEKEADEVGIAPLSPASSVSLLSSRCSRRWI